MRIAYLTQDYPALSHTFIQREVLALRELGADVRTYSIRPPQAHDLLSEDNRRERSSTKYVLPPKWVPLLLAHLSTLARHPLRYFRTLLLAARVRPRGLRGLLWGFFYFAEAVYLASQWKRDAIDHVHIHFAMSCASPGMLASTVSGVPYSLTVHGPSVFYKPHEYGLAEKVRRAAFVVCISNFCRAQVMSFSDADAWNRLHVVHCGVDSREYQPAAKRNAGEAEPLRLVSIGRLIARKGFHVLLEAVASLKRNGANVQLALIGEGAEKVFIENRIKALQLEDQVELPGAVGQDKVPSFYERADIFVLPSFAEGVPVVLMEAMAKELPVVATRIMGVPELVEDNVAGLLVTPGVSEELVKAIEILAGDEELRKEFGRAGREKVVAEFDSTKNAREIKRLFDQYGGAE